jgi:CHAD domain-containing protein
MREVEAKFRVHPPYRIPELTGETSGIANVTGPTVKELRAVYWDTSDLRLAREGITLRYRSGEGDGDGWHLKLPIHEAGVPDASTGVREELHDNGPDEVVPDPLQDLVAVHVRGAMLGPVATLLTARSSYDLVDAEGVTRAELTDDLVSVLNQGHVAGRFREIEVESVDGDLSLLQAVGTLLRAAGAVGGEFVPKVVRALGPQATAEPDPPPPGTVDLRAPGRLAVQAILRRYVRAFMAQDLRVRRGQQDSIHQMRVSARRLRSALKTFGPLVDDVWAKSLREELAWVADSLGRARDGEVLLHRVLAALDHLPPELVLGPIKAKVEGELGGNLVAARVEAIETLRTERYLALVDRLVDAAWEPMASGLAEAPARETLPECIGSAWRRLARDAARLSRPAATDEDWHDARIAAKQVRYAAEALAPFYGRPAKAFAAQAEEIQELLGEHQDAVIASDVLRRMATSTRAGSGAFTLGLLYARQQDVIARTRDAFPAVWAEAGKPKHRKWLRG